MKGVSFTKKLCAKAAVVAVCLLLAGTVPAAPPPLYEKEEAYDCPPQPNTIKGVVKDAAGNPAEGITIQVKGTQVATVTRADGSFTIQANKGEILLVSAVSYGKQEITVTDETTYTILLQAEAAILGDVVVVGYGRQTRKNLTTSVTSVKAEDLNRGAISDPAQLLQGKVPGLNITRSGDPNRSSAIVLRGVSTLRDGAQSPFFVIDGVPGGDISALAPDDIVSMDVLKDAAATSIYGNRGANGVIMVTTRRARKGQLQLNYNGYVAMEKVSRQYDMMDAPELKAYLAKNNQALTPEDDKGANTNWQSEVERSTGISHNHNVSFGGGTEHTLYSASINYFNQQGIIRTSNLNRTIARLSIEQKAFDDHLKLGISITNSGSNSNLVPYRNTVLAQMLTYLPTVPVKNADGSYYENFAHTNYYNPVSLVQNAQERLKNKNLLGSLTAQLKLPWGLMYDLNLSYQNYQNDYGAYYNSYYTRYYNNIRNTPEPPINPSITSLTGVNGQAFRNTYQNTNRILETYFTWNRQFGGHTINAVLGYSWQRTVNGDGFQASSTNFPVDAVSYNNLGLGNPYGVASFRVDYGPDNYGDSKLISDFLRVNYNYKDKYLVQGSLRRDGSSVFGKNERWGYFPSVGLAWRLIQENFLRNQRLFNDLKLRVSYGVTGNSFGIYPLTAQLIYGNLGTFYYNGTYTSAIGPTQNENPNLRWEKTATTNIGLDFSLLGGKLSGTLEVYEKKTTDLIYSYNVNTQLYPYPTLLANVGSMSNKGFEVTLNARPVKTRRFSWETSLNMAHNTNKIVSLSGNAFKADSILLVQPDGGGQTNATLQVLLTGKPLGQFFTLQYAGKNSDGVSQYYDSKGNITLNPLNKTDYRLSGNAQPKLLLGWVNTFRYNNFDLNLFFRSVLGNKIFNVTRADLFRPTTANTYNIPVEVAGESPKDYNSFRYSTRFIESGSYLRLDNATIGYNFKKMGKYIQNLRCYVTGNNLFLITGYKGIDPEINQGGLAPGVDANNFYPKTRTFMAGVNVSF